MRNRAQRPRDGFVLPFVLVTLLVVAALAGATSLASWRAVRGARLAFNGERALQGADEALLAAMSGHDAETFAARAIGSSVTQSVVTADGGAALVAVTRTAPLAAVATASMQSRTRGSPDTASRRVTRYLWLDAPPFPMPAALTVLADVDLEGAASITGIDTDHASDGCGPLRDTASVSGVHAVNATVSPLAFLAGTTPLESGALVLPTVASARAQFASSWSRALPRVTRTDAVTAGSALAARPLWSARRLIAADTSAFAPPALGAAITLGGTSRHTGMLLVDGDLHVTGTLVVEGLLLVRGAIDASAGTLDVRGAVIAAHDDASATPSVFGNATSVRYSRCTVARAYAAVARPRVTPFTTWVER